MAVGAQELLLLRIWMPCSWRARAVEEGLLLLGPECPHLYQLLFHFGPEPMHILLWRQLLRMLLPWRFGLVCRLPKAALK